jgi:hypothetical protein
MTNNIHKIKQNILKVHAKRLYSVEQDKFLSMLLTGKSGQNGWRNFDDIIKAPPKERKLGRIEAALLCEYQKTPWWRFYIHYTLSKIKAVISHLDLSKPDKIAQIKLLMNDFSDQKYPELFLIQKINKKLLNTQQKSTGISRSDLMEVRSKLRSIPKSLKFLIDKELKSDLPIEEEFNDIDHLIQAISKEVLNKQQTTRSYRHGLIKIRTQLQTLQNEQVKSWAVNLKYALLPSRPDLIDQKTTDKFNGTLMLPIQQGYDYRLGHSGGECFGYAADWCRSMLENTHYNSLSHDAEPLLKRLKAASLVAQRYPDLNHLAPLTRYISDLQGLQRNTFELEHAMSLKGEAFDFKEKIWTRTFTLSIEHVAKQLISEVNSKPDTALILCAMGYLSGHAMGFCKKNNVFHFYDSNFGWVRFNTADDFEKWLPFYFDKIGYARAFGEYVISSFEKKSFWDRYLPKSVPHLGFLGALILLPIIVPLVIVKLFCFFLIRGVYYAGRSLVNSVTSLFKSTPKEDDEYFIEHVEEPQNTVDDLSFFMASKVSKEQTVNMHNAAGVLFKDSRLLERKTSASDIGLFSKNAKDDIDLVSRAESYAFQP